MNWKMRAALRALACLAESASNASYWLASEELDKPFIQERLASTRLWLDKADKHVAELDG